MPIRRGAGAFNSHLEITLYYNRVQLATEDALYSDGDKYMPAIVAINTIKAFLPSLHNILVLGCGLGSMVQVIRGRGFNPHFTLVEKDKVILQWAMEFLGAKEPGKTEPVCNDAEAFMAKNKAKFDFIFLDVFIGRVVPPFVYTPAFLIQCRNSLVTGGHIAFNYIVNSELEWENVKNTFADIFPEHEIVKSGINRVLIGKNADTL